MRLPSVLSLCAGFLLLSLPATAQPTATLTQASGGVEVLRAGVVRPGIVQLQHGDVVRVGAEGRATLLYRSGRSVRVGAGISHTVASAAPAGGGSGWGAACEALFSMLASVVGGSEDETMAAALSGGPLTEGPLLVLGSEGDPGPDRPALGNAGPARIAWHPGSMPVDRYEVALYAHTQGAMELLERGETADTAYYFAADLGRLLEAHGALRIVVHPASAPTLRTELRLRAASAAQRDAWEALRESAAAEEDPTAQAGALAGWLAARGLLFDAEQVLSGALRADPSSPALRALSTATHRLADAPITPDPSRR